jgi:PAS domain S-box-containing protein
VPYGKKTRYFRWYHLYYILALFGVATIAFSLFLNQTIIAKYNASIEENRQWSLRLKIITELSRIAADVNAPGNDVFENQNVPAERQRLELSLGNLKKRLKDVRGQFQFLGILDQKRFPKLDFDLQAIENRLEEHMVAARETMDLFESGKTAEAARKIAVMDRSYYNASAALRTFYLHVTDIQRELFAMQSKELEFFRSLERIVGGVALSAILTITFYGHKLAKQITRDESEKEQHVLQLHRVNEGLERKTNELQSALTDLRAANQKVVESERKFEAIFDHTFQFIGLLDASGNLLEINRTALDFAGMTREEVVGRKYWETYWWSHSPDLQAKLMQAIYEARQGALVRFEASHLSGSGEIVPIDFSLKPVINPDGSVFLLIPEGRDITEKRAAESRVSEFYSTVSHELRTPLTAIRGSLGLIAGGLAGPISDDAANFVKIANEETDRLIRLINDILDLRKIEAGMLELRTTRISARNLVEKTINNLNVMAHQSGVSIIGPQERPASDSSTEIVCDEDRLLQVLTNLVSNAIKFSPRDQQVTISLDEREPGRLRFSVKDMGCGIPQSQRHKLFGKFQQVDQTDTRKKEGSGLGLAISKALVEQHGGVIGFDSDGKNGSTFWFEVPLDCTGDSQSA